MWKRLIHLTASLLAIPATVMAQSWTLTAIDPPRDALSSVPSSTQAIADLYFSDTLAQADTSNQRFSLVPSYVHPTPLTGVSLFYDADTGHSGRISDIGHGRFLVLDQGPAWIKTEDLTSKRNNGSLTIVNTSPDGGMSWRKLLD